MHPTTVIVIVIAAAPPGPPPPPSKPALVETTGVLVEESTRPLAPVVELRRVA